MLSELRAATPGQTLWDKDEKTSVRGLHVRVLPDSSKHFFLYYRTRGGRQRKPKIGIFGDITLAEARRRATTLLAKVSIGEDPMSDWATEKREMTVLELFEATVKGHWSKEAERGSKWASKEVHNLFKNHLKSTFGTLRLSEVTPLRVREWHAKYEDDGVYVANRALQVLSRMFNFAEEQELRNQHTNPCRLVKSHPEKKRKRFASKLEMQKIAPILEREAVKFPTGVAFLYLLMFSGSRPSAIERAEWSQLKEFEVNGESYGILTFKGKNSGKTGQNEEVVLPPQAMRVMEWLPRIEGRTITGIKMPRKLWNRVKKEAGCEDLWARDWRRTFATVGMSNGVNMSAISELLNHETEQTTKIYAKLLGDTKVEMAMKIASNVDRIMKEKTG